MQTTTINDGDAVASEDLSSEVLTSEILASIIGRDGHVLLPADAPQVVLDRVAARLAALRSQVLRPSTIDALTLPGLLAQLVGRTPGKSPEAPDLERGFEMLTDPGMGCDRIVLLLDRADAIDPAALRYVQLLIRDAPLRLLFVGGPVFYGLLVQEDFGALRRAFVRYATETPTATVGPAPIPLAGLAAPEAFAAAPPSLLQSRKLAWSGRWLLVGASMAASAVGISWLVHSGVLTGYLASTGLLAAVFPAVLHP